VLALHTLSLVFAKSLTDASELTNASNIWKRLEDLKNNEEHILLQILYIKKHDAERS
jgi:hypothetical protein